MEASEVTAAAVDAVPLRQPGHLVSEWIAVVGLFPRSFAHTGV